MVHNSPIISDIISFLETNLAQKKDITVLIDAGAGMGWLSFWLRMLLEDKPFLPQTYTKTILAIELFGPYASIAKQKGFYDQVYTQSVLDSLPKADCFVSIEVLEHLTPLEARTFLETITSNYKYVFLTTPNHFFKQDHLHDNSYQEHKSYFSKRELERFGLVVKNYNKTFFIYSKNFHWFKPTFLQRVRRKILPEKVRLKVKKVLKRRY